MCKMCIHNTHMTFSNPEKHIRIRMCGLLSYRRRMVAPIAVKLVSGDDVLHTIEICLNYCNALNISFHAGSFFIFISSSSKFTYGIYPHNVALLTRWRLNLGHFHIATSLNYVCYVGGSESQRVTKGSLYTVKHVYNDHLMGYLSAFWNSSRWPGPPPRWAPEGRNG